MDELPIDDVTSVKETVKTDAFGTPVTPLDIESRLEENLYQALSDGNDETVLDRINSAQIYVGAILRNFGVDFNLDDSIIRELVILNTIYEMHLSHGHEEAGKEYRYRAKDIILVTWGDYKDNETQTVSNVQTLTVSTPRKGSPYRRAFDINRGRF